MTLIFWMLLSALLGLGFSMETMAAPSVCKGLADFSSKMRLQEAPANTDVFPVVSKHLSPGFIEARGVDVLGLNPVFMVSNDSLSRNWLRTNMQRLKAIGLVVNAASPEALHDLCALADGL